MKKKTLELKVPPPILLVLVALLMFVIDRFLPQGRFNIPSKKSFVIFFVISGVLLAFLGKLEFRKHRTTINPLKPEKASKLVSTGIFSKTRNPMYLGLILILMGLFIFLSNIITFLGLIILYIYLNKFQISPEERALEKLFGDEYISYKKKTRR